MSMNNIEFSYQKDKQVLKGLSFDIQPNEIVGLLGANGSGKTTTFNIMSGLLKPDEGELTIGGFSIYENLEEIKKNLSYIPDELLLYPTLTGEENLNLFALLWGHNGKDVKKRAHELLMMFDLFEWRNKWVRSYSRGMQQKLSLCAALIHNPTLLLMDEPFTGIDVGTLPKVRTLLKQYSSEARNAMIFTSHTPEIIESLATRVLILNDGEIKLDILNDASLPKGTLIDIYSQTAHAKS